MSVTIFDSAAPLRFAAKATRGDRVEVADFTIEGEAALAGHQWIGQIRTATGVLKADLEVQKSVVTVTSSDDSLRIVLVLSATHSAGLLPGVYMVETADVDDDRTWATGTLRIERDWAS